MTKDETKPITRYNFQGEWLVSDWLISAKDKEIISWRKISERRAQEIVNKNKEIKLNEEGWNKCASKNFMLNQEIAELELYIRNMAQQIMEQSKEIKRQIQDHGKTMELLDARNKEIEELKKNISVWEITSKEETSKIIAEIINKATEIADLKKENEELTKDLAKFFLPAPKNQRGIKLIEEAVKLGLAFKETDKDGVDRILVDNEDKGNEWESLERWVNAQQKIILKPQFNFDKEAKQKLINRDNEWVKKIEEYNASAYSDIELTTTGWKNLKREMGIKSNI